MTIAYQKPLKGKTVGVVFGSFAPLHQGHLELIMRAKKENDGGCIVLSCGYDGDKGEPFIPHDRRYRYVREFFKDDDLVAVYPVNDTQLKLDSYPNGWDGWLKEFWRIFEFATTGDVKPKCVWYVGDMNYYDDLTARGEKAVLVDRTANLISGTMIRKNPIKHWNKITPPFRRAFSHNILITGTASEGKTTLTEDLGRYFNAPFSHEWARDYMIDYCAHDTELDELDFISFLYGQYNHNREMINSPANKGVFFADTDSLVTKMYAEYYSKDPSCIMTAEKFKIVADLADALTARSRWDKIFMLIPHGEFVDDHTRYMEHSSIESRNELLNLLIKDLKNNGLWDKVVVLNGTYYENFETIKNYVVKEVLNDGEN